MKKLFITLALCVGFMSCSSDDDGDTLGNPVTNIEIPQTSAESPIKAGETVTIKGKGFLESSEIWLRAITKSTDNEIKAEITSVTTTGISFVAPSVSGERNVILKQSGKEYSLGKIYFESASNPDPSLKKRIVKLNYGAEIMEFSYNTDGRLEKVKEYDLTRGGGYNDEIYFVYNAEGRLMLVTEIDASTKEIEVENSFEYVDNFTIKVKETTSKGGLNSSISTLTLNDKGQLVKLVYDEDDESFVYEYDEKGNVIKLLKSSVYTGKTTYAYKYDDKVLHLANQGLPSWYWIHDYSNITKNYIYLYAGANNIIECSSEDKSTDSYKYDYDADGYPTAIYDVNENNKKIGEFTYELIK